MWVIGGRDKDDVETDDIYYSRDGRNWRLATANPGFPARSFHATLVFQNKIWVIASLWGSQRDVWYWEK
jgi:hypothetical protein